METHKLSLKWGWLMLCVFGKTVAGGHHAVNCKRAIVYAQEAQKCAQEWRTVKGSTHLKAEMLLRKQKREGHWNQTRVLVTVITAALMGNKWGETMTESCTAMKTAWFRAADLKQTQRVIHCLKLRAYPELQGVRSIKNIKKTSSVCLHGFIHYCGWFRHVSPFLHTRELTIRLQVRPDSLTVTQMVCSCISSLKVWLKLS